MNRNQRRIAVSGGPFRGVASRSLLSACAVLSIVSAPLVSPGCNMLRLLDIDVDGPPSGCTTDDECTEDGLGVCLVDDGRGICVECTNDSDCDDGGNCTIDTCLGAQCSNVEVECEDGEECDTSSGECFEIECEEDGDCADGDPCTNETCENSLCVASEIDCDDGLLCTGTESCDRNTGECVSSGDPCQSSGESCDEDLKVCRGPPICLDNADCDDGVFCNGTEWCDEDRACQSGDDPCADVVCGGGTGICSRGNGQAYCAEGNTGPVCSCAVVDYLSFTLSQDNLRLTSGDDCIYAGVEFDSSTNGPFNTLQTGDISDGLAGTDRLFATFIEGGQVLPTLVSLEILNIHEAGESPTILDASNITGAIEINSDGSSQTLTVIQLASIVDLGITDSASGIDVTFQSGATSGSDDSLRLTLSGCMDGPDSAVTITTGAANGFETVVIESGGVVPNSLGSLNQVTGDTITTLVITGDQDLTLGAVPNTVETIDATGMFGDFQLGPG